MIKWLLETAWIFVGMPGLHTCNRLGHNYHFFNKRLFLCIFRLIVCWEDTTRRGEEMIPSITSLDARYIKHYDQTKAWWRNPTLPFTINATIKIIWHRQYLAWGRASKWNFWWKFTLGYIMYIPMIFFTFEHLWETLGYGACLWSKNWLNRCYIILPCEKSF